MHTMAQVIQFRAREGVSPSQHESVSSMKVTRFRMWIAAYVEAVSRMEQFAAQGRSAWAASWRAVARRRAEYAMQAQADAIAWASIHPGEC